MKVRELARIRAVKAKWAAKRLRFLRPRRRPSMDPKDLRGAKGALRRSSEELADEWVLGEGPAPAHGPGGDRGGSPP